MDFKVFKLTKKPNTKILVVTDSREELDKLLQLLNPEFGNILNADNASAGTVLFKKYHPSLLVLAFGNVSRAERFYLSLYDLDPRIYAAPHKTLLLCRGSESEQAYKLCKDGIINDYVADRPLFDPFRLRLSVSQALKHNTNEQNLFWLNRHVEKINSGMHEFNRFIKDHVFSGKDIQEESVKTFKQYTSKLTDDLGQLEKNLMKESGINKNSLGTESENQYLSEQIDQFRHKSIEAGSIAVRQAMNQSDQLMKKLDKGLQEYSEKVGPDPADKSITEVLLVDDDDMYREIVITMLKSESIHVHAVGDGHSALRYLMVAKPDIILLDYVMPDYDGLEVLKDLKSNPATNNIPVIMLTGDSSREIVGESIQAGAAKFLVKPCSRSKILSKIKEVLGDKITIE